MIQCGIYSFPHDLFIESWIAILENWCKKEVEGQGSAFTGACVMKIQKFIELGLASKIVAGVPLLGEIELEAKVAKNGVAFS